MTHLKELLSGNIYRAYSYSYPHKSAYRPFDTPIDLSEIWQEEDHNSLFLYLHIPYCEMRCGFCNLFTLVRPNNEHVDVYLQAVKRQCEAISDIFSNSKFARFAIGGGTPTYLTTKQLDTLFNTLTATLPINLQNTPFAIESSPDTIDKDKIQLLQQWNADRISIGIQSFIEQETQHVARRQSLPRVYKALDCIRSHSTADLNIDLIYGIPGQTEISWEFSLNEALKFQPEEIYLYPLYIREKTGLNKIQEKNLIASENTSTPMAKLYRIGREQLIAAGYQQISMRMFRKKSNNGNTLPKYSCQDDGMLGLGAGARSYTQKHHYSSEYAVGRHEIHAIIEHYLTQTVSDFKQAHYGVKLNPIEQKRRYIIQSILLCEGLSLVEYQNKFQTIAYNDFPELYQLIEEGLAEKDSTKLQLNAKGIECADTIGWWLISPEVRTNMEKYELR